MAKRRKMILAGQTYSIKDARRLVGHILKTWPLWEILVGEEFDIVRDCYGYHPEQIHLADRIDAIRVGITVHASHNKHRAFHVRFEGDEDFIHRPSYLKCFEPGPRPIKCFVSDALRDAVQSQVDRVRRESSNGERGHIHHDGTSFAGLRDQWVFENGGVHKIEIEYTEDGKTHRMTNERQRQEWCEFHEQNANLIFMTAEEHSKHHYNR